MSIKYWDGDKNNPFLAGTMNFKTVIKLSALMVI